MAFFASEGPVASGEKDCVSLRAKESNREIESILRKARDPGIEVFDLTCLHAIDSDIFALLLVARADNRWDCAASMRVQW